MSTAEARARYLNWVQQQAPLSAPPQQQSDRHARYQAWLSRQGQAAPSPSLPPDVDLLVDLPETGPLSDYSAWFRGKVGRGADPSRLRAALAEQFGEADLEQIAPPPTALRAPVPQAIPPPTAKPPVINRIDSGDQVGPSVTPPRGAPLLGDGILPQLIRDAISGGLDVPTTIRTYLRSLPQVAEGVPRGILAGGIESAAEVGRQVGGALGTHPIDQPDPILDPLAQRIAGESGAPVPYRAGVGVGRTIAGIGAAPVSLPISVASWGVRALKHAIGLGPEVPWTDEALKLVSGIIPPIGAALDVKQRLADPSLSEQQRGAILEDWIATQSPGVLAATIGIGRSMLRGRTAAGRDMPRPAEKAATVRQAPPPSPEGTAAPPSLSPEELEIWRRTVPIRPRKDIPPSPEPPTAALPTEPPSEPPAPRAEPAMAPSVGPLPPVQVAPASPPSPPPLSTDAIIEAARQKAREQVSPAPPPVEAAPSPTIPETTPPPSGPTLTVPREAGGDPVQLTFPDRAHERLYRFLGETPPRDVLGEIREIASSLHLPESQIQKAAFDYRRTVREMLVSDRTRTSFTAPTHSTIPLRPGRVEGPPLPSDRPGSKFAAFIRESASGERPGAGLPPPGIILDALSGAAAGIRESEAIVALKRTLGTKQERLEAILGKSAGSRAYYNELLYEVRREMGEADLSSMIAEQLTIPEVWQRIRSIPYLGRQGAATTSRILRRLPVVGSRFGVSKSEMPRLFDAVESIKELSEEGDPIFGTKKWQRDPAGNVTGWSWRYTDAQGQAIWNRLSPQAKEAAKWWVVDREIVKQTYGVSGNVEGYIHHFWQDGVLDGFKRIFLRHKTASSRRLRTEATGFVRDFEKAVLRGTIELHHERLFNDFLDRFKDDITEPITSTNPLKPGWREIPRTAPTRSGRYVGQLAGGRQIPSELYDDFVRYVEGGKQASELMELSRAVGRFYKANVLIHPGTAATNFLSGAIQFGTKVVEDFYRGALTGKPRPFLEDLVAPVLALRPSAVEALPPQLFGGGRTNVMTELGIRPGTGGVGSIASNMAHKYGSITLAHYGAIENYWKRVITTAELRRRGVPLDKDVILANTTALKAVNEAVDQWAFNYANVPKFLEKFRQHPLGALTIPFPTYGYKLTRMYGRYLSALNPVSELTAQERMIRIMTLGTILGMVHLASDPSDDKVGRFVDGMPWSLDRTARIKVREKEGKEDYLRVIKYPWGNFYQGLQEGRESLLRGEGRGLGWLLGEFISDGPLVQGWNLATGLGSRFDIYQPTGVRQAEIAKVFIPGFRVTEGVRAMMGGERTYPRTFKESLARAIPLPLEWMDAAGGKVAVDRATGRPVVTDPSLEALKFWFGVNLKRIDPRLYDTKKLKMILSNLDSIQRAGTPEEFEKRKAKLVELDPRFRTISEEVGARRGILIPSLREILSESSPREREVQDYLFQEVRDTMKDPKLSPAERAKRIERLRSDIRDIKRLSGMSRLQRLERRGATQ